MKNICIKEKLILQLTFILGSRRAASGKPDPVYNKLTRLEIPIQSKTQQLSSVQLREKVTSMSYKLEPIHTYRNLFSLEFTGSSIEANILALLQLRYTTIFKVAPYSFLTARELILKISRWRELSNSMPKSRAKSRSKMPTKMASKLLKFVYRK